jgi:hypothetical protein
LARGVLRPRRDRRGGARVEIVVQRMGAAVLLAAAAGCGGDGPARSPRRLYVAAPARAPHRRRTEGSTLAAKLAPYGLKAGYFA